MKELDPALTFANARLFAALYFGLLSIVGTILISAFMKFIGIEEIIPLYQAIILGAIVAATMGALFGERIIHCEKPYQMQPFWMGFAMVMASLPLFDLGLVVLMKEENDQVFSVVKFHDMVFFYMVVLAYSYILFGIFLAIASGIASMYLRGHLVYDVLHILERHQGSIHHETIPHKPDSEVSKNHLP
ncbi:MAG: hypothetical protein EPN84_07520 [Legionella sp.]|nr:MAG: hypothetical protein EPN84_07520 [Legionella sp.]